MTRTILVTGLCVVALAGCGRTVVRETVVERPAPVARETVIERPAVALAAPPVSCSLAGSAYATGSLSCQGGFQHRCNNGVWERLPGTYC